MNIKLILAASALMMSAANMNGQVTVNVDVQHPQAKVSDNLYGIFFEDINHAADGGLYAELIQNRSFEDDAKAPVHWTASGNASASLSQEKPLNQAQTYSLKVAVNGKGAVTNDGFWGINAVKGQPYRLSFFSRGKFKGTMTAALVSSDGTQVYASAPLDQKVSKKWTKSTATLTSNADDPRAHFVIRLEGKGNVWFDVVSLFPPTFNNRPNGLRPDLANMLKDLHPKFVRFPGGCFVEGQDSPDNAFRWERTIGPIEDRPGHKNVNWGYRTTDGIGFHDYLQMTEDLGAKPLYVVNVGIWHGGFTPVDSIQPWIDETMNALEYANGPVTSKYGALRAQNGHPAPFNIEYLEIGNENNQPVASQQSDHYYDRFRLFRDAVLAKYPNMHIIGNVAAWGTDHPTWDSKEQTELVDEHYYRSPAWFTGKFNHYDNYDRKSPKVYVGEYAVTQGFGKFGDLYAALGEAVFMQGLERNADHVLMASYAPIFANLNNVKWRPDMIQFNSASAFGTPSYYVQKMMADNIGTRILNVKQENPEIKDSVSKVTPAQSQFGMATWNTQATFETTDDGQPLSGTWSHTGKEWSQTSGKQPAIAILNANYSGTDRSIKLRARKDGGKEGFIVVFNYVDSKNYAWVNFGGWDNTQHGIEVCVDGSKSTIATKRGSVDTGRWYDLEVRQHDDSVYASINGKQIFATKLRGMIEPGVFSNATLDANSNEVIVKITNTSSSSYATDICLNGATAKSATAEVLSSKEGTDENDIDHPHNVYPATQSVTVDGENVKITLKPYSLSIVRIKL